MRNFGHLDFKISFCLFIYLFLFILGKFVNHKGRNRHFTNPEELEEQRRQEEEKRQWRVSIFRLTTSSTT